MSVSGGGSGAPNRGSSGSSAPNHSITTPAVSAGWVNTMWPSIRRRDAHPCRFEEGDGGIDVRDLHRDRTHVGSESLDEAVDGAALDDRFADLDDVVADPGHAAAATDRRIFEAAVLEHPEPDEVDQRVASPFVVGHHRRGVEAPSDVMAGRVGDRHDVGITCSGPGTWRRSSSRGCSQILPSRSLPIDTPRTFIGCITHSTANASSVVTSPT